MIRWRLWLAIGALALPAPALAHGVRARVDAGDTTMVTVTHEDGEPLAGASFTVRTPGAGLPYAAGTTDEQGRLRFCPDRPGEWRVRVATADGHGTVVTVTIAPKPSAPSLPSNAPSPNAPSPTAPPAAAGRGSRPLRALLGALVLAAVGWLGARVVRRRSG